MWEVEKLLFEDPELKVIHLVRDPRGVYVSRRAVRYYFADAPFCARLNADASMSSELQVKYPGESRRSCASLGFKDTPSYMKELIPLGWDLTIKFARAGSMGYNV